MPRMSLPTPLRAEQSFTDPEEFSKRLDYFRNAAQDLPPIADDSFLFCLVAKCEGILELVKSKRRVRGKGKQ